MQKFLKVEEEIEKNVFVPYHTNKVTLTFIAATEKSFTKTKIFNNTFFYKRFFPLESIRNSIIVQHFFLFKQYHQIVLFVSN